MTLTLAGRLQTRLMVLASVGVPWTLIVSLPLGLVSGMSLRLAYRITLEAAIALMVLGLAWEIVYHGMQQFRWDKDWPTAFGLLTVANEGVLVWLILHLLHLIPGGWGFSSSILPLFVIYLGTTWALLWAVAQGPLRFVVPRWRFEGGTFSRRTAPNLIMPFIMINIGVVFGFVTLWAVWS
jgi:hypothetical protein